VKVAFLGATRGMGRALARLMAERGDSLFLLGRDRADVEKSAADLQVRAARARSASPPATSRIRRRSSPPWSPPTRPWAASTP